jgi:hypothetical protein
MWRFLLAHLSAPTASCQSGWGSDLTVCADVRGWSLGFGALLRGSGLLLILGAVVLPAVCRKHGPHHRMEGEVRGVEGQPSPADEP